MVTTSFPTYGFGGTATPLVSLTPAGTPDTVKWNPGFYWAVLHNSDHSITSYSTVLTEMNAYSALRGMLMRISWPQLEPTKDNYNFSAIDTVLTAMKNLANGPKQLAVIFELKSNKSGGLTPDRIVPTYVQTAEYGGGDILWGSVNTPNVRGYEIRLWEPKVIERLKLLSDQFKTRYNDDVNFEMLQFTESAVSPVKSGQTYTTNYPAPPSNYDTIYINGLRDWVLYTNLVMTKTQVMQLCNYPRGEIATYILALRDAGVGISCPNSLADEPGLWTASSPIGIWPWLRRTDSAKVQGVVAIGPSIQIPECYYSNNSFDDATGLDGLGKKPGQDATPPYGANGAREIISLLKSVNSNYAFITRSPLQSGFAATNNPNGIIYTDWLTYLSETAQTSTPHGGLNATKPSKLA